MVIQREANENCEAILGGQNAGFALFIYRGVQMGKSAILKKIHNAAKNYQRYLAGKTFMYVYEGKSIEVVFKNSSFLHLTGVNTKLKAKEFYKHAKTKNGLKVQEFFFDKDHPYDLAEKRRII